MDDFTSWVSILEYCNFKGISISSARRYIKASKVEFKKEHGKYFILIKNSEIPYLNNFKKSGEKKSLETELEIIRLSQKIQALEEEKNDLRMLVELYEEQLKKLPKKESENFPELPSL